MVLKCFGKKNLVYTSITAIIKYSGFYKIAVKTQANMIQNLQTFIWLLQKMMLHMRILCVTLLQISKLKHGNYIIWIRTILLTLRRDIMKMKWRYIVENVTLTLHAKINTSWILTSRRYLSFPMVICTRKNKSKEHRAFFVHTSCVIKLIYKRFLKHFTPGALKLILYWYESLFSLENRSVEDWLYKC